MDPFEEDLTEEADGRLSGRTPSGSFTIDAIRLNRAECILFRLRRRSVFERIQRLKVDVADMPLGDLGRALAEEAIMQAEAEWAECYGVSPRVNG